MAAYGTDDAFNSWLAGMGYTLPSGAPTPAILRARGTTYIDSMYGARFVGIPTGGFTQELAWPRSGAVVYGQSIPDNVIPVAIEQAAYRAAYAEAVSPGSLNGAINSSKIVKRQKVGEIEREFFGPGEDDDWRSLLPFFSDIEGALEPYLIGEVSMDARVGIWALGC